MKHIGRKNYGSIPHLLSSKLGEGDHFIEKGQERILTEAKRDRHDRIFVHEKYDGSNVGIAKLDGKVVAITRAGYDAKTSPFKHHHYFAHWVEKRDRIFAELLGEGDRISGEWLAQAHGLMYRISGDPIVFFDYFNAKNERANQEELRAKAAAFDLRLPRLLHEGDPVKVESLLPILNQKTPDFQSVDFPEGMVYRAERRGKVDFLAKWVRLDFPTGVFCINVPDEELVWNVPEEKLK